jgi:UDP-N-acetylglucosamine 1-carboxyvinyltransferase
MSRELPDHALVNASPWWRPRPNGQLRIRGGIPLSGAYEVGGAKNAVLPLMVSALLTPHLVTLHNVPAILDVAVLSNLLQPLGVNLQWSGGASGLSLTLCADRLTPGCIDPVMVSRMRASILLLGTMLGRCGEAALPMPGGDDIGLRGIDFHIAGLRAMGAHIEQSGGMIRARAPHGLHGAELRLPFPSVGATQNLLLAAVLARGTTVIRNAAREPENSDLVKCLVAMGAEISGAGSDVLTISGGRALTGAVHTVMPDRIELGTIICAAAATDGELLLGNAGIETLGAAAPWLAAAGVSIRETEAGLRVACAPAGLTGNDFTTGPYPGFATDLQPPVMALLAGARGASAITETMFEQRFKHVEKLRKMGANIAVRGTTAWVRGVPRLQGAEVTATDVRAAAALVLAGLGAKGDTNLRGLDHLDRGYDHWEEKLRLCGADISRF